MSLFNIYKVVKRDLRRRTRIMVTGIVLVMIALTAACGPVPVQQYAGPQRPDSEIAVIYTTQPATQVMVFDGRRLTGYHQPQYKLLPGPHRISVAYESSLSMSGRRLILDFTAEEGPRYLVYGITENRKSTFFVIDDATDRPVSRIVGGEGN